MKFYTNLRPQTFRIYGHRGYDAEQWLLSSHRATPSTLALAAELRGAGKALMADNGTKPMIDRVLDQFAEEGRAIWQTYRSIRQEHGEVSMTAMPDEVRRPAGDLADRIADHIDATIDETAWRTTLNEQLEMDPTHLIAPEDFCIGSLAGSSLDRAMTGWSIGRFTSRNRVSLRGWQLAMDDDRARGRHIYVTLGAADYHTARAAARTAAEVGARNVAIGFAGLNHVQTATGFTSLRHRRKLDRAAGTRYVRLLEIILGLRDGYREANVPLERFHGLGLGSRAQYPALAAVFDPWTEVSVDATSPLHDAVNGRVLYDAAQQGRSIKVNKVANAVLDGNSSLGGSRFLTDARRDHGHDESAARQWWESDGRPRVEMSHLKPGEPLAGHLGWLSSGPGSTTSKVTEDWIGHNHSACDELCGAVPNNGTHEWARRQIEQLGRSQGTTITRAAGAWLRMIDMHDAS